ncbi:MAG: acyl-CoA dehydrogenase, partial [Nitriliruptor sp.]
EERLLATLAPALEPSGEPCQVEVASSLTAAEVRTLVAMGPSADHLTDQQLADRVAVLLEPITVTVSVELRTFRVVGDDATTGTAAERPTGPGRSGERADLASGVRRVGDHRVAAPDAPTATVDQHANGQDLTARVRDTLDGRWAEIRRVTREELRRPELAPGTAMPTEEHRERVMEQLKLLGSTEGPRLLFPEAYGGGGDLGGAVTSFETLAMGDLSLLVKAGVQFGLFGGAIMNLGNEEHRSTLLPKVMTAELPGCFAMTETGHGSDVAKLRTTATYDAASDELIIHTPDEDARKDYIGNAARDGRMAVVFCQLVTGSGSHGVHGVLVPIRDESGDPIPGVTISDCGHKAGLNGVDNGRLSFAGVRVPRTNLLDRYGSISEDGTYRSRIDDEGRRFFTTLGTLVQGRISVSGAALSAAKVGLAIAVRYGLVRRQFEAPGADREIVLLDYRQHQRRLMPLVATTYALHAAQESLVAELDESFDGAALAAGEDADIPDRRVLESMAAGIKTATTWHATHAIQTAREACGGAGYLSENRLPELKADTDVFTTFEGDNTVLLQLVAKGLLTDFRDEFSSLDTIGTVRFVADQVVETVVERTAARRLLRIITSAVPGRDDDADFRDRDWQLELFAWREEHIVSSVARRLQRAMGNGGDPFEAFNDAQDHVLAAAQAHIDRVVLERFCAQIEACADTEVAALLSKLRDLHVLSLVERERGWFLEHGRLSASRSKAITAEINRLCAELREHAQLLVDAWAIPDEVLAAPIALGAERDRQDAKYDGA